jgi:hypothetical protein
VRVLCFGPPSSTARRSQGASRPGIRSEARLALPSGRRSGARLRAVGREAPLDEPARASQPRDRQTHRRRWLLPQRPLAHPARCQRRDRAERRVARRSPLPLSPLAGGRAGSRKRRGQQQRGGPRAHRCLSSRPCRRVTPLPGLDSRRTGRLPRPHATRRLGTRERLNRTT